MNSGGGRRRLVSSLWSEFGLIHGDFLKWA